MSKKETPSRVALDTIDAVITSQHQITTLLGILKWHALEAEQPEDDREAQRLNELQVLAIVAHEQSERTLAALDEQHTVLAASLKNRG